MRTEVDADHSLKVYFSLNPTIRNLNISLPEIESNTLAPEEVLAGIPVEQRAVVETYLKLSAEHSPITAIDLMHIPIFRDFFRDQVLPIGVSLKVTRVALIFTDLRGSTAMYAAKGDPQAFDLVRRHFEILGRETELNRGVIVKTIGDAIMASFQREVDAARAAVAFHHALENFNRQNRLEGEDALMLKVGLHAGPSICVTLNNSLDYFGTTVNMAARVAALSQGRDLVISQETLANNEVQEALRAGGFALQERTSVNLKGLPEATEVCFLSLQSQPDINEVNQLGGA
jgi:class 3 adenylate cyclase